MPDSKERKPAGNLNMQSQIQELTTVSKQTKQVGSPTPGVCKRYSRVEYANVQGLAIQSDSGKDGMKEKINGSLNCQEMMRRNKEQR